MPKVLLQAVKEHPGAAGLTIITVRPGSRQVPHTYVCFDAHVIDLPEREKRDACLDESCSGCAQAHRLRNTINMRKVIAVFRFLNMC